MKITYKQQGKYKNEERMDSVTEDWNGWQLCFLKTYYPKCFPNSFVWFVMFDIMLGRHICLTQCKADLWFCHFQVISQVSEQILACVAGVWKYWAQERTGRARETREERGSACPRGHENRFHSLSESAEGSYCSYLREQYLAFYNTQHAFLKKYPFLTLFSSYLSCLWLKTI